MKRMELQKYLKSNWTGREDGVDQDVLRWHQIVQGMDLADQKVKIGEKGICFVGYACDLGAKENKGRAGSRFGPVELRKMCASFPVHNRYGLYDAGDIGPVNDSIYETQQLLGRQICEILDIRLFPIVLGGDHSLAFGHYLGLQAYIKQRNSRGSLGIINFDAHFDIRKVDSHERGHSGSSFYQMSMECQAQNTSFRYLPVGIQKNSNTVQLYKIAESLGVSYISADEFGSNDPSASQRIADFINRVDYLYLSICLDAFSVAFAPGVSAPAGKGVIPSPAFYSFLRTIVKSGKLISMDIAELNPAFDEQQKTAKLGAGMIFEVVDNLF